jgi:hypothetical protein
MEFQGGWNSNTYACNFNVASTLWHELHRIIRVGAEESGKGCLVSRLRNGRNQPLALSFNALAIENFT